MEKKILDVTCGARTMWFNKHHPAAVYCDKRREEYNHLWKNAGNCSLNIDPDVLCDFTDLPFQDNSFPLVVFDPPHLTGAKETAWLVKKYGKLDDTWPQMLHDGFLECMRVLKPDGELVSGTDAMEKARGLESNRRKAPIRSSQRKEIANFLGLLYEAGRGGAERR